MTNNDILRSVRYMLDLSDAKLAEIAQLGGQELSREQIAAYLKKEDEAGYQPCHDGVLGAFLDGLVLFKRGQDDSRPPQPFELPVDNNKILKKLRVAFELKEQDLLAIFEAVKFRVSKPELSALFRNPSHANYRPCGDQLLRNFLKGLTQRLRG